MLSVSRMTCCFRDSRPSSSSLNGQWSVMRRQICCQATTHINSPLVWLCRYSCLMYVYDFHCTNDVCTNPTSPVAASMNEMILRLYWSFRLMLRQAWNARFFMPISLLREQQNHPCLNTMRKMTGGKRGTGAYVLAGLVPRLSRWQSWLFSSDPTPSWKPQCARPQPKVHQIFVKGHWKSHSCDKQSSFSTASFRIRA